MLTTYTELVEIKLNFQSDRISSVYKEQYYSIEVILCGRILGHPVCIEQ